MLPFLCNNNSVIPKLQSNATAVATSVGVACSVNVNMTLVQTVENRLFGLNYSRDVLVLNFYVRGKILQPLGHIYMDKTGIVSEV